MGESGALLGLLLGVGLLLIWRSGPRAPQPRTGGRRVGRRQQALSAAGLTGINGAQLLALAFSPSTYAPRHRPALARHVYLDTAPNLLWFTAIDWVGPSRASLFANLQPFLAAVIALLLLHESLTRLQLAGGLLIAAGIVFSRRNGPAEAPR